MTEGPLFVLRPRRGRPPVAVRADRRVEFRVTPADAAELAAAAAETGETVAGLVRAAVAEYIADYRDRVPFTRAVPR